MLRELSNNFEGLLRDEQFANFWIVCGEETFSCHRAVLASRSSFFRALFNSQMDESKSGKMVVVDMSTDTIRDVLMYIYSGRVEEIDNKAMDLLEAADRFDLPGLKKSCEECLIGTLDKENVLDLFVLADLHNAVELREAAKTLIVDNSADIVQEAGWREKLGKYQSLVFEIFEAVVSIK